jgi:hypothetical protein
MDAALPERLARTAWSIERTVGGVGQAVRRTAFLDKLKV